jgi:hypothetical protein
LPTSELPPISIPSRLGSVITGFPKGEAPPPFLDAETTVIFSPEYVFVVKIHAVKKTYDARGEQGASEDTVRIVEHEHFTATGDCVTLKYIDADKKQPGADE